MVRRFYKLPSLNALGAFEAAALHSSLSFAATELNVTPSAVSKHVTFLEQELGVPLFVRGHRSMRLTPEGERVLSWARQIIADYESLKQDLTVSDDALFGTLRLASIPATLPSLPHLITPFCERHQGVSVQVQSMSSIAIQRALDDLEIDEGDLVRYRCHVGHAYNADLMSLALEESLHRSLSSALRALEERAAVARKLHAEAERHGRDTLAPRWALQSAELEKEAESIRDAIRRIDSIATKFAAE